MMFIDFLFSKKHGWFFSLLILASVNGVQADYLVTKEGAWPNDWPKAMESLRQDARTFEGPMQPLLHHAITFSDRNKFESVWPVILKLKSQGAPIILKRGFNFWIGDHGVAGVCIHTPPAKQIPISGIQASGRWENTNYIELIVDGEIVDLNRIIIPADTPIIDQRFSKSKNTSHQKSKQVETLDNELPAASAGQR